MQNQTMINQERMTIAPLVERLTQDRNSDRVEEVKSTALNVAVNLRRGLVCSKSAVGACVDCELIGATNPTICDFRNGSSSVVGTTLFTVDI